MIEFYEIIIFDPRLCPENLYKFLKVVFCQIFVDNSKRTAKAALRAGPEFKIVNVIEQSHFNFL